MSPPGPGYSFARSPRWVVGHLLAVIGVVAFIGLGMWQLSRHSERTARNDQISEQLGIPPVPLEELVAAGAAPEDLEYRRVTVTGEYSPADEVVLRARSRKGVSGNEVLTPVRTDVGAAIIVDRGWVPIDSDEPPVAGAEPPGGVVTVTGVVRLTEPPGGLGPRDPTEGRLSRISRVDIDRLSLQIDEVLAPFWVQLEEQAPPQVVGLPLPVDLPALGQGPHLGYAGQWFIFALVVLIGYPLLLRRTAMGSRS